MSVAHKLREFPWDPNATWRSLAVVASAIVLVVALIVLGAHG